MNHSESHVARAAARRESGFTLLEIMIVLGIIALIMGVLVLPNVMGAGDKAKIKTAQQKVAEFAAAYERWSLDNFSEECPGSLADLLNRAKEKDLKDPWGREYVMLCGSDAPEGESFGVASSGPDRKMDTEDDIKSWEL